MAIPSRSLLSPIVRRLHVVPMVAMVFLYLYGRLVCPFMDRSDPQRLLIGLGYIAVVQIMLREALLRWLPISPRHSLSRHGYRISVVSWLGAGLFAVTVHYFRYPDFHPSSHLKLLLGYWVLGAGILAQLEYSTFDRHLRRHGGVLIQAQQMRDRLGRRLMESFLAFSVAPALALILMAFRYQYEGYIIPGVTGEISFIIIVLTGSALYVAWHYGRLLHEDAEAIVRSLEQIERGNLDVSLSVERPDEIGRVAVGIAEMAAGLRQRERMRDLFGRFVSPAVAQSVLRGWEEQGGQGAPLRGQARDVTVLMADLRGFTPLSERLAPAVLTDLLNGWLSVAVSVVDQHGGVVDKFIGDAVMAVFGLYPQEGSNPAEQAVRCGVALNAAMDQFNQQHAPDLTLALGVGIHSGPVIAGMVGSLQRMEFTVIGSTVNTAARIEFAARNPFPAVLCSAATAQALDGRLACRSVGSVTLKGIMGPVMLYSPLAAGEGLDVS